MVVFTNSRGTSRPSRPEGNVRPPRLLAWLATALLPQPPTQPPSGPRPQPLPSKSARHSQLRVLHFTETQMGILIFQAKFQGAPPFTCCHEAAPAIPSACGRLQASTHTEAGAHSDRTPDFTKEGFQVQGHDAPVLVSADSRLQQEQRQGQGQRERW